MGTVVSVTRNRKEAARPLKRLPKLTPPRCSALNGLCPYYTMFRLSFPFDVLATARTGEWVFDPFCGRGTTILAARLRGLPSVGVDSNPVAGAIAAAKLAQVRACEVGALARKILTEMRPGPVPATPQGDFWGLCYAPGTLRDVCRIRNYLLASCTTRVEVALRGVMLGILHGPRNKGKPTHLSNQMPRSYSTKPGPAIRYWRKHGSKPVEISVLEAVRRRARFSFKEVPPSTLGKIITGDSRTFEFTQHLAHIRGLSRPRPITECGHTSLTTGSATGSSAGQVTWITAQPDEQLSHQSEDKFVSDLATVWKRTAEVCLTGAKFICRFGALRSRKKDPRDLFKRSLSEADCGWRIVTIRDAGTSHHGHRQCDQFGTCKSEPLEEIDVYAVLET